MTEKGNLAREAGRKAWHDGKSIESCPWIDEYDQELGFWDSPMGLRQIWRSGFMHEAATRYARLRVA